MAAPRCLDHRPDAAIKLFGRTIPVLGASAAAPEDSAKLENDVRSNAKESSLSSKNNQKNGLQAIGSQHGEMEYASKSEEVKNGLEPINSQNGKMKTDSKPGGVKTESDESGQEKVLKKPDKILPCPRCYSMETKFCYFNNYNLNQPRHYCRSCKRYWTAGGTMRNVPEGSGRRRNKPPSHYHHATNQCDSSIAANGEISAATHRQSLAVKPPVLTDPTKETGTVSKSESVMFCKSVSPVLNTKEHNNTDLVSLVSGDSKEEKSCGSSAVVSGSSENWMPENTIKKEHIDVSGNDNGGKEPHTNAQSHHVGPALVFSRDPAAVIVSNRCSTDGIHGPPNGMVSPLSLLPPPMIPAMGIHASAVPLSPVPPFSSCIPGWPNGVWNAPWSGSSGPTSSSLSQNSVGCSGSISMALGKHPREANLQEEEKAEKKIWIPKALRIDNPEEAAKSSIWTSLGIKPDERIIMKSFQSKDQKTGEMLESAQALQANPAAFSRSQTFQERTWEAYRCSHL
ncbi:hypothetical protein U9M48_020169 [Paspalum notatum var. saurae]|uniref:Dof-type domain-containing protein n=1 Tax=Paspalum notatum var. saurae TaxID=547442 RepID=A0AAQ3TEZ2_PASNO